MCDTGKTKVQVQKQTGKVKLIDVQAVHVGMFVSYV